MVQRMNVMWILCKLLIACVLCEILLIFCSCLRPSSSRHFDDSIAIEKNVRRRCYAMCCDSSSDVYVHWCGAVSMWSSSSVKKNGASLAYPHIKISKEFWTVVSCVVRFQLAIAANVIIRFLCVYHRFVFYLYLSVLFHNFQFTNSIVVSNGES